MFKFSIIVPIFQEYNIFELFIDSLFQSIEYSTQIIFIDDNSPREVRNKIDELCKAKFENIYIQSIYHNLNRGSTQCINEAFSLIKGELVAIIDSDTILNYGWQSIIINTLYDTTIGGIGSILLYPQTGGVQCSGITYTNGVGRHLKLNSLPQYINNNVYEVQASIFAFFVTTANIVKKIGLLDTNFFNGYEDIDYQMRIRKLGYKIVIQPKLKFYHWEKSNGIHREYNRRSNQGIFWKKHGDFIKEDLWDFIFEQLNSNYIDNSYIGVDLCCSRRDAKTFWDKIIEMDSSLILHHLDYSYNIKDDTSIWLPQIIHYDFFRTTNPILFLCDNFVKLIGNDYWFKMRQNYSRDDLIVDLYGNVLPFAILQNCFWPGNKIR